MPSGEFVEIHPDSARSDSTPRPTFKSDAGRTVFGGGGIRPDVVVADDTLATIEREFLRSAAPYGQTITLTLQDYSLELKGTVAPDFKVPAAWTTELMRRLSVAKVKIDPKFDSAARVVLTRDLEHRVTRLTFGDAAAKARALSDDHQLLKAIELLQRNATQAQLLAAAGPGIRK